ncbi:histone-fold-containing protein [Mycena metata]|uniref:DNA polymerase epsilon subunit D n=1 Tax=Mycena metata TaxID=1033252 RepID=A0AAD7IZW0_9AGAR|nr:histone-fold-containing protein [Mycena metata]
MPRKETPQGAISAQQQQDIVSEGMENFELPKSLVTRIARSALPENVKLQKETVLSLIKGSTVFINYLGAAHDVALSKQHKSISASDVLKALEMIEFGDLVDKLQAELVVYREQAKTDKSKKGSSNVNSNGPKGKTTVSVASTTKSVKGKEKATIVLPPLASNSTPLDADPSESISSGPGMAMDVDEDVDVDADPSVQVETDGEGEGGRLEEEEEEEVEDVEDVEEEAEELVDTVALDIQDLKGDSRGPDEVQADMDD